MMTDKTSCVRTCGCAQDCVTKLKTLETTLPNLMQQLMQSTVKVIDSNDSLYRESGVVEDVTMCGLRQRRGTVGYTALCSAVFYVVVRIGSDVLRRYRIEQLELVQSPKERMH
jgi:hypothetical protein